MFRELKLAIFNTIQINVYISPSLHSEPPSTDLPHATASRNNRYRVIFFISSFSFTKYRKYFWNDKIMIINIFYYFCGDLHTIAAGEPAI